VRRIALFAGAARVTAPKPRGGETGWGRALGREHLDLLLRDAATQAGAVLFQPADLTALEHNAQGHVCHLKCDGESATIAARTVIAATGSWRVKPPFAVRGGNAPSDLFAFKAHFITSALGEGVMPLLAFAGGYGGMVHTDNGRTSLSCCIRRGMLDTIRRRFGDQAGTSVLRHICETTLGAHDALAQAALEGAVLSAGPIRPGMRPRYENGVFFCGNLAGEAHPIIAEGISMAIQSSWLLSRHLIAAGPRAARERAGMAYARDWRRHFGLRLAAAWTFAHAAMDTPRLSTAMIRGIPALLTLGTELSGKLRPLPIDC
jgi:flavin-dependent dehydrogenase